MSNEILHSEVMIQDPSIEMKVSECMQVGDSNRFGQIDFSDPMRLPPKSNMWLMWIAGCTKYAGTTIIFTTGQAYCEYVGLVGGVWPGVLLGAIPLTGAICTFMWQIINDQMGYKFTNVSMCLLGAFGAILYAVAGALNSPAIMFLGRVIQGAAASANIVLHYFSISTGKASRHYVMSRLVYSGCVGIALGPLISGGIHVLFGLGFGLGAVSGPILFNVLSIPGWTMAVIYLALALSFYVGWHDLLVSEQHRYRDFRKVELKALERIKSKVVSKWLTASLIILLALFLCIGTCIGAAETRTVFVAIGNSTKATSRSAFTWGWTITKTSFFLSGMFLVFGCLAAVIGRATKATNIQNRNWLVLFYSFATVFSLTFHDFDPSQSSSIAIWSVGLIVFETSLSIAKAHLFTISSSLVPNRFVDIYSSFIGVFHSAGRGLGPILATYVGNGYDDSSVFTGIMFGICASNVFVILLVYRFL